MSILMFLRFYLAVEYFIVTRFLRSGVNPIMRALFRLRRPCGRV